MRVRLSQEDLQLVMEMISVTRQSGHDAEGCCSWARKHSEAITNLEVKALHALNSKCDHDVRDTVTPGRKP